MMMAPKQHSVLQGWRGPHILGLVRQLLRTVLQNEVEVKREVIRLT